MTTYHVLNLLFSSMTFVVVLISTIVAIVVHILNQK